MTVCRTRLPAPGLDPGETTGNRGFGWLARSLLLARSLNAPLFDQAKNSESDTAAQARRVPALHKRRDLKMARDAHAYVRGSTQKFYEWLETTQGRALPEGPRVWICGDAHVGNLGPIARCDAVVEVELRDLDQTVPGNPAHDLGALGAVAGDGRA